MRRSREVPLTLLAAAAALAVSACHRDCVDAQNRVLPDSACRESSGGYGGYGAHFLYGGHSGGRIGDSVLGGSARGGFGGFGAGHGSGGGGE